MLYNQLLEWDYATHLWQHDFGAQHFHLSNRDKPAEDKEKKSEEVCLGGTSEGKASIHNLQERLIQNKEAFNGGSTAPISHLASFMPPAPPDNMMPDNQEQKLNSTAVYLIASLEEPLLLDPP